jgi:hypothetical protein
VYGGKRPSMPQGWNLLEILFVSNSQCWWMC